MILLFFFWKSKKNIIAGNFFSPIGCVTEINSKYYFLECIIISESNYGKQKRLVKGKIVISLKISKPIARSFAK